MEGPRCADPLLYHRGVRCTKDLTPMPQSLADKHPVLNLTTDNFLCRRCSDTLSSTGPRTEANEYKQLDVTMSKNALKKAALTRVARRRQAFKQGTIEDMKAVYDRCADPFLNHRGQRCVKELQPLPEFLVDKHPILLLTNKDKVCRKCLNDFQIYPDNLNDLVGAPVRSRSGGKKEVKMPKQRKKTAKRMTPSHENTGEECADPLMRHKGKLCVKGLERVTEDIITRNPLLLLTLHDKLCRGCIKSLEANSKATQPSSDQYLYNYDSEISRQANSSSGNSDSSSDSSSSSSSSDSSNSESENESNESTKNDTKPADELNPYSGLGTNTNNIIPPQPYPVTSHIPPQPYPVTSHIPPQPYPVTSHIPPQPYPVTSPIQAESRLNSYSVSVADSVKFAATEGKLRTFSAADVGRALLDDEESEGFDTGSDFEEETEINGFRILKLGIKDLVGGPKETQMKTESEFQDTNAQTHDSNIACNKEQIPKPFDPLDASDRLDPMTAKTSGPPPTDTDKPPDRRIGLSYSAEQIPVANNLEVVEEKGVDITQEQYVVYYDQDKEDSDFMQTPEVSAHEELSTIGDGTEDNKFYDASDGPAAIAARTQSTASEDSHRKAKKSKKKKKKKSNRNPLLGNVGERTYVCSECPFSTQSADVLKKHHTTHATQTSKTIQPEFPDYTENNFNFPNRFSPEPNTDKLHEKKYYCSDCSFVTKRQDTLREHRYIHTGEKPYTCDVCMHTCRTGGALRAHVKVHSTDRPFKCSFCPYSTKSKIHLRRHTIRHDKDRPMPFECPKCGKRFLSKYGLKSHLPLHLKDNILKCEQCNYTSRTEKQLKNHLLEHTDPGSLKCKLCDLTFTTPNKLKQHISSHRKPKMFPCPLCDLQFPKKQEVNNHIRTHGKKPFRCGSCTFTTNSQKLLETHMQQTHTQSNNYHCDSCPFSTWEKSRLDMHIRIIHESEDNKLNIKMIPDCSLQDNPPEGSYTCTLCVPNRNYTTQHILDTHIQIKHGIDGLITEEKLQVHNSNKHEQEVESGSQIKREKLEFI